jgi:predicted MFS family arabinose efflux permease
VRRRQLLQPALLHSIALGLQVSEAQAALTVTLAQVSYALGLLLLVPLGDMLERRRLAVTLMLLAAAGRSSAAGPPAWPGWRRAR